MLVRSPSGGGVGVSPSPGGSGADGGAGAGGNGSLAVFSGAATSVSSPLGFAGGWAGPLDAEVIPLGSDASGQAYYVKGIDLVFFGMGILLMIFAGPLGMLLGAIAIFAGVAGVVWGWD